MNLKRASQLATTVLVVAVVSLVFRRSLFARGPLAIALQAVAAALMLWARVTFGGRSFHIGANPTEGGLVTEGPYRFIRHPIYAAILLFVWAGVVSHATVISLVTAFVATVAITVRVATEEVLVAEAYPEYAEYARRTKRLIPFLL